MTKFEERGGKLSNRSLEGNDDRKETKERVCGGFLSQEVVDRLIEG